MYSVTISAVYPTLYKDKNKKEKKTQAAALLQFLVSLFPELLSLLSLPLRCLSGVYSAALSLRLGPQLNSPAFSSNTRDGREKKKERPTVNEIAVTD